MIESFSYSRRATLQRCPRLFFYQYVLGRAAKVDGPGLRIGAAYSDCLESGSVDAATEFYFGLMLDSDGFVPPKYSEELTIVRALAESYFVLHADELKLGVEREVPFERELTVDIGGRLIPFSDNGFFDGVIRHRDEETGHYSYTIIENKCKGRFTHADAEALDYDEQLTAYALNASLLFDCDLDDIELVYDVALKPQIRQRRGETHNAFCARLRETILGDPGKYHKRYGNYRTKEQCDAYEHDMKVQYGILAYYRMNNFWPKHLQSCGLFGGCEFQKVCQLRTDDPKTIAICLDEDYKDRSKGR